VELSTSVDFAYQALAVDERRGPFRPAIWRQRPDAVGQTLEQVWFAGVHSNVGGGYPKQGMSIVPLVWMMEEAERAGPDGRGLRFSGIDRQQYHERFHVSPQVSD